LAVGVSAAGGLFLSRVSGRRYGFRALWRSVGSVLGRLRGARVASVVSLTIAGLVLMASAPRAEYVAVETGYRYHLQEESGYVSIPDVYCVPSHAYPTGSEGTYRVECAWTETQHPITIYRYRLWEIPVYSSIPLYWLDPGVFFVGFSLVCAALLLTAYWLARANNRLYGVE